MALSFRRNDIFDNRLPNFMGDLGVGMNPALAQRLREADCLLVLGARLSDSMTGGYELIDPNTPGPRLLHVHPEPDLPGRVYQSDLSLIAHPGPVLAALAEAPARTVWSGWTVSARADLEAWRSPKETPGDVKLEEVVTWLSDQLPDDAIVTNGAGNYAAFVHRYFVYKGLGTQLAPTSGSMGYGFPAAVAASVAYPDRTVVCFAGDGCFQMTLNELATAVQYGATPIVVVANNGRYGTIRMHQEKTYPGRVSGTDMASPDFADLARAYGGHGETVRRTDDFPAAFARAQESRKVAVIELVLDPDMLSTGQNLSDLSP